MTDDDDLTGAVSPSGEKHPTGEILYEDRLEKRTWTRKVADVPVTIAWVEVAGHWKAVIRIEISGEGNRRDMMKFGLRDEFLETTTATIGPR